MAITYIKDTFVDWSTPDLDAATMNKIVTALDNVCKDTGSRSGTLDANTLMTVPLSEIERATNKTSEATLGFFDVVDVAVGTQVTLPSSGTFQWFVATYGATYNSLKSGISAGGLMAGTASANLVMYYKRLS